MIAVAVSAARPAATDDETQWSLWLDALATRLAKGQEALRTGRLDDIESVALPGALPPLPRSLAAEAERLLEQSQQLERALVQAQENIRRQLHVARRMNATTPTQPSMLEQRA